MTRACFANARTLLCVFLVPPSLAACGGEETGGTPTTSSATQTSTTGAGGGTGVQTVTSTGTTTGAATSATTSQNSAASTTTTTGSSTTTGTGATVTGTSSSTGAGGSPATATTGEATTTSAGGSGGNSGLSGGASGAFVCMAGASYGDPLEGMGAVQEIGPPQGGFFAFIEGPLWSASLGTLFFSDHSSPRRIFSYQPGGTPEVFVPDSASNGLALDNEDQLIVAEELNQRITRMDPTTGMVTEELVAAGDYGPNDVIYRSDGNIYFTDPSRGFYRAAPGGMVTGPLTQVQSPNGIVLSPDENTLYVGDVGNQTLSSFPLMQDGGVDTAGGGVFANTENGTVDGMAVDCAGNVYAGTSQGVEVFSPAGAALGVVPTGESSNVTFGGADRKTLYVASRALLKSVTLAVPGLPD